MCQYTGHSDQVTKGLLEPAGQCSCLCMLRLSSALNGFCFRWSVRKFPGKSLRPVEGRSSSQWAETADLEAGERHPPPSRGRCHFSWCRETAPQMRVITTEQGEGAGKTARWESRPPLPPPPTPPPDSPEVTRSPGVHLYPNMPISSSLRAPLVSLVRHASSSSSSSSS